ncbi:MAG: hypothetical protein AAF721_24485, partial [Myxococcota bacterium]
ARDEARHAALAWATIDWAVSTGSGDVADALASRIRALRPDPSTSRPEAEPEAEVLARFGRLDEGALATATQDAWRDIIEPMLARMLSAAVAERRKTSSYEAVGPAKPARVDRRLA